MITLCMDTSQRYLALILLKDDKVLAQRVEICFKQQSEMIFPRLVDLCLEANVTPDDIGKVVVTKGPGSYTGIRIAMSIAKVFCATKKIPCYTINTLQLLSGNHNNCCVLLDARSGRAYFGKFNNGIQIGQIGAYPLDEIKQMIEDNEVIGDGSLIGKSDNYLDFAEAFISMISYFEKVENVHTLVPEYCKSSDEYLVK